VLLVEIHGLISFRFYCAELLHALQYSARHTRRFIQILR